jgi:hypothetical protein
VPAEGDQTAGSTWVAPAPAVPDGDYRIELVEHPAELETERADALNAEVADLACRACGGEAEDEQAEQVIRDGWRAYCMNPGGRTQDYDRLGLVWSGDRLVAFTGWVVEHVEPDITVLWFKAAGTDPAEQGRGAFAAARDTTAELGWMTSYGAPTYFVMRTPNPVIYDTAQKWWARFPEVYERFFPKIGADGEIEPIDDATRRTAVRMAEALWPDCEFDADNFVIKDFLGEYGRDIWRVPAPGTAQPGSTKFFNEKLREGNQDAVMTSCLFLE